jgi:hypothetical protein
MRFQIARFGFEKKHHPGCHERHGNRIGRVGACDTKKYGELPIKLFILFHILISYAFVFFRLGLFDVSYVGKQPVQLD